MKWILIGLRKDAEKISFMKDFFSDDKKIDVKEFVIDGESNSFDLTKLSDAFSEGTHCIFFSADKISSDRKSLLILGAICSAKIESFFLGENEYSLFDGDVPEFLHCYTDFKKLSVDVREKLPSFRQEEIRVKAYTELFNKGLPFTADIFSFAIANEKKDIARLYIDAGMDINSLDSTGTPMLNIAVRNDSTEMVKWVLDEGGDINAVSEDRGYTAVMDAVWRKNFPLTKFLIERGATLDHISKEGQSILVLAVGNGNAQICELLLANGADSEAKDMMGMSARGYANLFKNKAVADVFEKYPAK